MAITGSAARITRAGDAPPYSPPLHHGVAAVRLQGLEAGPTERFWVGLSTYEPGGAASTSPTSQETVYLVLDGELVLTVTPTDGESGHETLQAGDSVHLPRGTVRSVQNRSGVPARMLVVIATAPPIPPATTPATA